MSKSDSKDLENLASVLSSGSNLVSSPLSPLSFSDKYIELVSVLFERAGLPVDDLVSPLKELFQSVSLEEQCATALILSLILQEGDEFEFTYKGYRCMILRDPKFGYLNGYVYIPSSHPLYNHPATTDEFPSQVVSASHGDLTYDDYYTDPQTNTSYRIIGFDTDHIGDFSPYLSITSLKDSPINTFKQFFKEVIYSKEYLNLPRYKTLHYVYTTLKNLVDALERVKQPSQLTCPNCHSNNWTITQQTLTLQLKCNTCGHEISVNKEIFFTL